jgi:pyruvate kinase
MIINKCRLAAKPVITATEMLQSMMENIRPTRAEVSDVANAVFDGTDAIMLSGETAQGKYPVKVVKMMEKIAIYNEDRLPMSRLDIDTFVSQSKLITHAVVDMIRQQKEFNLDVIVIFTETGRTARDIARFHSTLPVVAITESEFVRNTLTLAYGVTTYRMNLPDGEILEINNVIEKLKGNKILQNKQRVIFVHGDKWKVPGLTNTIQVKEI